MNRSLNYIISLMVIASVSINLLNAQNIHVATTGSDNTGNGSLNNPYATITKASQNANAGDTVFVHQGTYHNANFGDNNIWKIETLAQITCNGNANDWIVFMPFPGDSVLLEFDASAGVRVKNSSYVKVQGFHIKGIADQITFAQVQAAWGLYKDSNNVVHDLAQEMNINIADPNLYGQTLNKPVTNNVKRPNYYSGVGLVALLSHHIIFENNLISWTTASGLRVQKSDYTTVKNNEIKYCTMRTPAGVGALTIAESRVLPTGDNFQGNKIFIVGNKVHDNENQIYSWAPSKSFIHFVIDEGSGIFFTRNHDTYTKGYSVVANNLSYRNGASGIVIHKTDRVIVEHNTVYDNGTTNGSAKPGGLGFNNTQNVSFRNNIAWSKPNKFALGQVGGNNVNLTIDSNLLFNNNGSEPVAKNVSSGWFEANPQFINVATDDFNLMANSPAIDRGITSIFVNDDYAGLPRSDGKPDLGAYEYDPSTSFGQIHNNNSKKLLVYPNPTQGIVNVVMSIEKTNDIHLYNVLGKEQMFNIMSIDNSKLQIDISNLADGIYFLQTSNTVIKIIKR